MWKVGIVKLKLKIKSEKLKGTGVNEKVVLIV